MEKLHTEHIFGKRSHWIAHLAVEQFFAYKPLSVFTLSYAHKSFISWVRQSGPLTN